MSVIGSLPPWRPASTKLAQRGDRTLNKYRLRFFKNHVLVAGEDFQAEDVTDARSVAARIAKACLEKFDATELWAGTERIDWRPVDQSEAGMAAMRQAGMVDTEIALGNTAWAVRESGRLLERLAAKEAKGK